MTGEIAHEGRLTCSVPTFGGQWESGLPRRRTCTFIWMTAAAAVTQQPLQTVQSSAKLRELD